MLPKDEPCPDAWLAPTQKPDRVQLRGAGKSVLSLNDSVLSLDTAESVLSRGTTTKTSTKKTVLSLPRKQQSVRESRRSKKFMSGISRQTQPRSHGSALFAISHYKVRPNRLDGVNVAMFKPDTPRPITKSSFPNQRLPKSLLQPISLRNSAVGNALFVRLDFRAFPNVTHTHLAVQHHRQTVHPQVDVKTWKSDQVPIWAKRVKKPKVHAKRKS